jgi:predicted anti-sigma-YlaC factor YlaD
VNGKITEDIKQAINELAETVANDILDDAARWFLVCVATAILAGVTITGIIFYL